MVLGVSGGREAPRFELKVLDEQARHVRGASGRELPVGSELSGVDGDVVGVAFDADVIRRGPEHRHYRIDAADRSGGGVVEPLS